MCVGWCVVYVYVVCVQGFQYTVHIYTFLSVEHSELDGNLAPSQLGLAV